MPYGSGERVTYAKATPFEGFERDFKGLRVIIEMDDHLQSVWPAGLDSFDEWCVAHPPRLDLFMVSKADVPIRKGLSVEGMVSIFARKMLAAMPDEYRHEPELALASGHDGLDFTRRLLAGAAEPDRIIVVSTQQVRDLEHLIDPILVLEEGQIVFQHSVEEISCSLTTAAAHDGLDAIYTEGAGSPGARALVAGSEESADSAVDIELLFSAIVQDPVRVEEAFSNAR